MKFLENVATVEGNAIFEETVKMSVQNESIAHIIKSLTDMYSNPTLALSREYLSNAYDATIARMGVESSFGTVLDTPIEVTLPNSLNPNFIVRDYGTGMDRNVLANVFPQYGASTKRQNNNEIGGFGLGAKSALAVVANFTVVSVKDGKKNTGIVQKGEDGVGEISFLPEIATDEPSGTTVTINLPNPSALNAIFRDSNLLLGFPHGSILLNGKMHENSVFNTERYTKIGEDGWVLNSLIDWENNRQNNFTVSYHNEKTVVVGPISYRVSMNDLLGDDSSYTRADINEVFDASTRYSVLNLPIGSVDFTPARENLIFSERTRKAIVEASKRVSKGVKEYAQASLSEAPSKTEAARRADILRWNGFELDFIYKGEKIPKLVQSAFHVEGKTAWIADRSHKVTPAKVILNNMGNSSGRTVVVTGVKDAETAKVLNRLRKPFADRYKPRSVTTDSLTVLYTQAEKSELDSWAESLALEIFTAEEWETKGVAYRKEISAERRAARVTSASTAVINYGSVPVGVISLNHRAGSHDRPKVSSYYASDIAGYDTVIYLHVNSDAPATMAHKFAKTLTSSDEAGVKVQSLNSALSAIVGHYSQDKKTVRIVRVPANTKIETFLKAVPHAISVDDALKVVAEAISNEKETALQLLMSQRSHRYYWLSTMQEHVTEKVENAEVREFLNEAHQSFSAIDNYRTSNVISAKSNLVFAEDFAETFADFRETVKASNKFPLPLLEDMAGRNFKHENAIQYINLMYPASV